ncbi:MAG TPA: hypothetical protein VEJ46_12910 [Candidatus Acidoferrum sp.]|nr:hypothetical protein [Candidatus Acidoferrum sp.]
MADLTPSRIEPVGGSTDSHSENPNRKQAAKTKTAEKPAPVPPAIDADKDELHQLDEQA